MTKLFSLTKRNVKLFFKDKGMFFSSLVTPIILLVLYALFLANMYRDSFTSGLPEGFVLDESIIEGLVAGQLMSSILSVSCVTVAFCSNFLMVQDKVNGTIKDLKMTPTKSSTLSLSYYLSTLFSTLLICFIATAICLIYVATAGWYMSFVDVLLLFLDVLVLVLFGTVLSSVVNFFLSSQGQISAISSIVTAGYGFVCGAYMPIASFSPVIQKIALFMPGTYGTSLIRNHSLNGVFNKMSEQGLSTELIDGMKSSLDCNLDFFGSDVSVVAMYLVLIGTVALLLGAYVLFNKFKKKSK